MSEKSVDVKSLILVANAAPTKHQKSSGLNTKMRHLTDTEFGAPGQECWHSYLPAYLKERPFPRPPSHTVALCC